MNACLYCFTEAVIVRTASGTPARNLYDIAAIDNLTTLTELIVVKHTGMRSFLYILI